MNFVNGVISEFRDRRLWAVAAVLLVALIAVPIVLSKTPGSPPPPPLPPAAPKAGTVPALSVKNGPSNINIKGDQHDPFTPQPGTGTVPVSTTTTATTHPTTTTSTSSTKTSTTSKGSSKSSGSANNGTSNNSSSSNSNSGKNGNNSANNGSSTGTTTTGTQPISAGLGPTQSWRVTIAITTASGGLNTIDPVVRLSLLPSANDPLLIELGVLDRSNRVLFLVEPGTVVSGPGSCTPGPLDCEVLSLTVNQIESISVQTQGSSATPVARFAVTALAAVAHPTVAAAQAARRAVFKPGRQLLRKSKAQALSLFRYDPSLGALIDLRTLSAGGQ